MPDHPTKTELKVSTGKDWEEEGEVKCQGVPCWCCQPWPANVHPGLPAKATVGQWDMTGDAQHPQPRQSTSAAMGNALAGPPNMQALS